MKKAFVEAWLSGLRSGKYKQHRFAMSDSINGLYSNASAFCCLGLGCVIKAGTPKQADKADRSADVLELEQDVIDTLIIMNDEEKKTFAEIADWIEANILPNATE